MINIINAKLDCLNREYFNELKENYGSKCLICGNIQGQAKNSLSNYFCNHLTNKIENSQKGRMKTYTNDLIKDINKRGD